MSKSNRCKCSLISLVTIGFDPQNSECRHENIERKPDGALSVKGNDGYEVFRIWPPRYTPKPGNSKRL